MPQPYQFKFENTKDYLQLVGKLTFYFDYDGKIYESNDFYFRYYFEDIHYEPNDMKDYIQISPGVLGFAEVTSGP